MFGSKRRRQADALNSRSVLTIPFPDIARVCDVCGDERNDKRISVFTRERRTKAGLRFRENIRFCNDRLDCVDGAPLVFFVPEDEL